MILMTKKISALPIFIRGDDLEYGLRNMKHLILMNYLQPLLPAKRQRKKNSTESISYSGLIRMKMTASGLSTPHFLSRRKNENFRNFTVSIFLIPCFHVSAVILPAFSTMSAKNWSSLTVAMTAILSANFRRFAAGANPMCVSFIKSRY